MAASMGNFDLSKHNPELIWLNKPKVIQQSGTGEGGMQVTADKNTDFWQRTYYDPLLIADNGHVLYQNIGNKVMAETTFNILTAGQFDQAGLMVRKDAGCWIKTGLEYVDGEFKLSCVVTNTFSDWSTQSYSTGKLSIRIYRQGASFVVEAKPDKSNKWDFIRICHLNIEENEPVMMGLFTCSPKDQGGLITFEGLKYEKFDKYHHNAE